MSRIALAFWGFLALLSGLWLLGDPGVLAASGLFPLRTSMVQLSGVLAMGCMSLAMILALRPRWPEGWLGGLDRMYRLHKWLGIAALVLAPLHWLWSQGPKWAVGLGWLDRPARGPRVVPDHALEAALAPLRGLAEGLGEWAFYAATLLIVLALVHRLPYGLFRKTHRLIALAYLVLAFHAVVLFRFGAWASPLGLVMGMLLASGSAAAVLVLLGRVGAGRKAGGVIRRLRHDPAVHVTVAEIALTTPWPGHKAGQFAFLTADRAEGPHPYTIASAWDGQAPGLTFIAKELGDYTRRLRETLAPGQPVEVEGPYGCFTFEDECPRQIWIGGGIGITPFIARMQEMARRDAPARDVHLFHATAEWSEDAIARLRADAAAAGIRLHVLHGARDGRLNGERIRAAVPGWREASIWFCGPARFGEAIRRDFAAQGLGAARFHQELFAMR